MRRGEVAAVDAGPEEIDVGVRLREIRQRRGLTLREVAALGGVSESFLSQVERGRSNASIATLQRVASALGLTIGDLFESASPRRVLRRADRPALAMGALGRKYLLTPSPFKQFEVMVGEFEPGGTTGDEPYVHGDSEELLVIVEGQVVLQLDATEYHLASGDSIQYRSSVPHRIVNTGGSPAEVFWIVSPPSY
jgi:transcriptional regulator with XRE-family HTH domain